MASKMVTTQRKECLLVAGAALKETRYPRVLGGLLKRFSAVLPEGTTDLTLTQVQEVLGNELERLRNQTVADDNSHIRELYSDHALRELRDTKAALVRDILLAARSFYEGNNGVGTSALLFGNVDRQVPTDATQLHQVGGRVMDWLLDPVLAPPAGKLAGVAVDREAMAQSLAPHLEVLGQTLDALGQERSGSVDSMVKKRRSLGYLGRLTDQGGRFLEALYDLAGMEEESDRVRLSSHTAKTLPGSEGGGDGGDVTGGGSGADGDVGDGAGDGGAGDGGAGNGGAGTGEGSGNGDTAGPPSDPGDRAPAA